MAPWSGTARRPEAEPGFYTFGRLARDRALYYAALATLVIGLAIILQSAIVPQVLRVPWATNQVFGPVNLTWTLIGAALFLGGVMGTRVARRGGVVRDESPVF